jgi:hypothetical protein
VSWPGGRVVAEAAVPVRLPQEAEAVVRAGILPAGRSKIHLTLPGSESADLTVRLDLGPLAAVHRALEALREKGARTADEIAVLYAIHRGLADTAGELLLSVPGGFERSPVPDALARLRALQHEDGGFGWCGEKASDPFTTAVVLRALSRLPAGEAPPEVLEGADRFLRGRGTEEPSPGLGSYEEILSTRRGTVWSEPRSTAEACFRLLALARGGGPDLPETALVRVRLGRRILGNVRLFSDDLAHGSATFETPVRLDRLGRLTIHVEANVGGVVGCVAVLARRRPPDGSDGGSDGFSIEGPSGERRVSLGAVYREAIRLRSATPRSHVVVDCPFPAGTEPVRRTGDSPELPEGTRVEYLADRIRYRVVRLPAGETVLDHALRAVRRGRYRSPPATASLAYSPDVRAVSRPLSSLSVD